MKGDWKLPQNLTALLERWKYPAVILLAGVVLVLWPGGEKKTVPEPAATQAAEEHTEDPEDYRRRMERELEGILSKVEGAGRVSVLLTLRSGPTDSYQTDISTNSRGAGENGAQERQEKTVMRQQGSAYNEPILVTRAYPSFQGALIVCQGAGDPAVQYRILEAVAALLGLGAHQITVVKMK